MSAAHEDADEIKFGTLVCVKCKSEYPILSGVAVIVPDVKSYLISHVLGISEHVLDNQIPTKYRKDYLNAKRSILRNSIHIEDDLESKRVNALYLATHYLNSKINFIQNDYSSSLMKELIFEHWNRGPISLIGGWVSELYRNKNIKYNFLELGCGVGGLLHRVQSFCSNYLGVDSSFSSIAWARKINLSLNSKINFKIPHDLLSGALSREISISTFNFTSDADFIVCDLNFLPLREQTWDCVTSLNTIDMLDDPETLPRIQKSLLLESGIAIQSSPYVWHPKVAIELRKRLPKELHIDSARAVEWVYENNGLKKIKSEMNVPWIFFKHSRQIEIYSTHIFSAVKI